MHTFASVCLITADLPRLRAFYAAVLRISPEGADTFTSGRGCAPAGCSFR